MPLNAALSDRSCLVVVPCPRFPRLGFAVGVLARARPCHSSPAEGSVGHGTSCRLNGSGSPNRGGPFSVLALGANG